MRGQCDSGCLPDRSARLPFGTAVLRQSHIRVSGLPKAVHRTIARWVRVELATSRSRVRRSNEWSQTHAVLNRVSVTHCPSMWRQSMSKALRSLSGFSRSPQLVASMPLSAKCSRCNHGPIRGPLFPPSLPFDCFSVTRPQRLGHPKNLCADCKLANVCAPNKIEANQN